MIPRKLRPCISEAGTSTNVILLDCYRSTEGPKQPDTSWPSSKFDKDELKLIYRCMCRAIEADLPLSDIGIITLYTSMNRLVDRVVEYLAKEFGEDDDYDLDFSELVHTGFDGIQGRERRFMIVSLVVTESFGFVNNNRRLNTALSRASGGLILIANAEKLSET